MALLIQPPSDLDKALCALMELGEARTCLLCSRTVNGAGAVCGACASFLTALKALRRRYPHAWDGLLRRLSRGPL